MTWDYWKDIVSRYPLAVSRNVFPTAGQSMAVMVGARQQLNTLRGRIDTEILTVQTVHGSAERVTDWDAGRLERNLAGMRASLKKPAFFTGPKSLALKRIIATSDKEHPLLILVLPVSPIYVHRIGAFGKSDAYEQMLADALRPKDGFAVMRLDQIPAASDPTKFCDLVHLNRDGSAVVTPLVSAEINRILPP